MENKIRFFFIYILFFNVWLVKTDTSIYQIDFKNEELWRTYNENASLKIDIKTNDLPNYVKLIAKDQSKGNNISFLNLIISYYQDISFTNRKQLSHNSSDTTIMWLNKEQIKNGFYLDIECGASACKYNFSIIPENSIKLYLGQIYKYYITEQNKEMKFNILGNIDLGNEKKLVTIYAKGYRDIYSQLEKENNIKHSKYNAYIIDNIKSSKFNCNFTVNGNVGDLVTVGAFFCEETGICTINEVKGGYEYSGFLKKNVLEENCFLSSYFYYYSNQFIFNDIYSQAFTKDIYKTSSGKDYKCIQILDEVDEIFYSFYIYNNSDKYIPLISGNYDFYSNANISFIPLIAEDFNFLTYKIYTFQKGTKIYITKCTTYPLCNLDLDLDKINNIKEFENFFYNYFITFNKNELESDWSPINKNQHVILFRCKETFSENGGTKIEIFTDKTVLDINTDISNYYFIEKGKTNNFFSSSNQPEIISIETISGDISIKIIGLNDDKNDKIYNYNNIYSYECNNDEKFKMIQIKAKKNSIYNIKTQIFIYDYYNFKFGGNYVLKLNNNDIRIRLRGSLSNFHEDVLNNYLSIYSNGCHINAATENHKYGVVTIYSIILKNNFYQSIFMKPTYDVMEYITFEKSNEKDSCLVSLSYFLLNEKNYESIIDSGLILVENIPRFFSFDKNNKEMISYFYYTDLNKKINLELKLLNEGNYEMIVFINNEKMEKEYNISSNETIPLEENNWENICKEPLHICIFKFIITYYNESDSLIEMKIQVENNIIDNDVKNNNIQTKIILFIILIIVCLIIIVAIIFLILKMKKRKNKNVIGNMNQLEGETELMNKDKD